jgi:hypothetical protein
MDCFNCWSEDLSGWLFHQHRQLEQMMEYLVATIEVMNANLKEVKADQDGNQPRKGGSQDRRH